MDPYDRRRDMALLALVGGCVVMTVFVAVLIWMLQAHPGFLFWIAMFAMSIILVSLTALAGLIVKREVSVTKSGVVISDKVVEQLIAGK